MCFENESYLTFFCNYHIIVLIIIFQKSDVFSRDFILKRDFMLNLLGSIVYETRLSTINFSSVTPTLTIVYLKEDHVVSINIYACIHHFAQ